MVQKAEDNQNAIYANISNNNQVDLSKFDEISLVNDDKDRSNKRSETGDKQWIGREMSTRLKYTTAGALCYCYFALAVTDYIFGPTLDDMSKLLAVSLSEISLFATIRQFSYMTGAFGSYTFNYINRQLAIVGLMFLLAASLIFTPMSPSLAVFFIFGGINGFASGAVDAGLHVWMVEMFSDGGGPLLQALHFAFGMGTIVAPSITGPFLSESEGACLVNQSEITNSTSEAAPLQIPYSICAAIQIIGGLMLAGLFIYQKYIPPEEDKIPKTQQNPSSTSNSKRFYTPTVIVIGAFLIGAYFGLEITYFQFVAPMITATPGVGMTGSASANVETALAGAYALCLFISIFLSMKLRPQQMLYFNFIIIDAGALILLLIGKESELFMWIGNVLIGVGFSSTFPSIYTFLKHQVTVDNTVGSVFLFTSGLGSALFPILVSYFICTNSMVLVYLCLVCIQISSGLFFVLHVMSWIRSKKGVNENCGKKNLEIST